MLTNASTEIRQQFRAATMETDPQAIRDKIMIAREAAAFLKESVVQATLNERGNYAMKPSNTNGADRGVPGEAGSMDRVDIMSPHEALKHAEKGDKKGGCCGGGGSES